jgi:hypothetical protein
MKLNIDLDTPVIYTMKEKPKLYVVISRYNDKYLIIGTVITKDDNVIPIHPYILDELGIRLYLFEALTKVFDIDAKTLLDTKVTEEYDKNKLIINFEVI